jgi:hypothetical protein
MAAGYTAVISLGVWCRNCYENPVAVLYKFLNATDVYCVTGSGIDIVSPNVVFGGHNLSTVQAQFSDADESQFLPLDVHIISVEKNVIE